MLSTLKSQITAINLVPPTTATEHIKQSTDTNGRDKSVSKTISDQPTLLITSYDRFTPPHPRPDLEYDCRTTANPSREIRASNTGIDEDLQSVLLDRDEFSDMLARAVEEVYQLMEERKKLVEREARDNASITVRVGCLCGSGHHRSVAFAECLKKKKWPSDWKVEVTHRDLTDEVVNKKHETKKKEVQGP